MKNFTTCFVLIFTVGILIPFTGGCIPAFARMYNMSCMTCHNPIPRLKPYGDTFAGNGFRLTDREAPRYFQQTGDDMLSLIRDFPLAVRLDGYMSYENIETEEETNDGMDVKTPFLMKLMSGGMLSEHLAYYFYFYLYEQGEVAGVEDAFVMYNNLFDIDLDIYLGQFQVSDPMFKRELRLTLEDYYIYTITPGLSDINLTYDKGLMVTYGSSFGTNIVGELLNGNGIGEANKRWRFDKDQYKDVFGRVSQEIGENLSLGGFIYAGKEKLAVEGGSDTPSAINKALLWGPDASINFGEKLQINLQYLHRTDSKVIMDDQNFTTYEDVVTQGALGEIIYTPRGDDSRWYYVALYNWADSDVDLYDFQSATAHAGYLLKRNVRLVSEFTYRFTTDVGDPFWRASLGFVAAF
jgi:hypothetical protein